MAFAALHAHALHLLLAGLAASIGATLIVHLTWQKANKAKRLAQQRTAELRSLNAILVADIEAHRKLADSLSRSHREVRRLAEHNARVKEDERKRIAREIHDDLGQSMLALRLELAQVDSSSETERNRERLKHALGHIDHTVNAMRLIINELRPAVLDLGLDAAIDWEIAKFRRRTGIHTSLHIRTSVPEPER